MAQPAPPMPLWRSPRGWFALAIALVAVARAASWGGVSGSSGDRWWSAMFLEELCFAAILALLGRFRSLAWAGMRAGVPSSLLFCAIAFRHLSPSFALSAVVVVLMGLVSGVVLGPFHALLYAPAVLAMRGARERASLDAHDGVAVVTMSWAAVWIALLSIPQSLHQLAARHAVNGAALVAALGLVALAAARRASRRRWSAGIRAGTTAGFRLLPAETIAAATQLPWLADADAAVPEGVDGVVVREAPSAYRGGAEPWARTSLAERPRPSLLGWVFTGVSRIELLVLVGLGVAYFVAAAVVSR